MLHPLKFKPQHKERLWGGNKLAARIGKQGNDVRIGESWELSGLSGDLSIVSEGDLAGNNIEELIEVYMGDLVGEKVYDRFGVEFPLLIKLIDAQETLSVQVHPDDTLAAERHNAYGKNEFWYIMEAEPDAKLYLGFNRTVSREEYQRCVSENRVESLLQSLPIEVGDAFFVPAGTIHAIGKGSVFVEIQQTSDITYRISDWGRVDAHGNSRELHTELALDAINFNHTTPLDITAAPRTNEAVLLKQCPQFAVNLLHIEGAYERTYIELDSFVVLVAISGSCTLSWDKGKCNLKAGESILIPASLGGIQLQGEVTLLETYIP